MGDVAMIRDIKERAKRLEKKSRKNTIWCHQHAEYKTFAKWFDIKLVELKADLSIPGTGVGIPAVLAAVGPPAVLRQAAVMENHFETLTRLRLAAEGTVAQKAKQWKED